MEENDVKEKSLHQLNQKISRQNKIITSLAAGAIAGALAKTVIAPLDRTKINFQVSNKEYSFRGAIRFILCTVKHDGLLSLWRGNSATMARIVPYAALQYASHEQWKQILNPTGQRYLPPGRRFMAGSLAGVTASSMTYPLDLARARLAVTEKAKYSGLKETYTKIYREEGFRILFRGYTPTVLGVIPYAGTSFFTFETCKKFFLEYFQTEPTSVHKLGFGALAGLLGQTSCYPLDIARRRMQTAGVNQMESTYKSIWSTLLYVYRMEGITRGLYKGLSMNWIKGPISVGVSFTVFEYIQKFLRKHDVFHN